MPYHGYLGEGVDTLGYLERSLDDSGSGVDLPAAVILEVLRRLAAADGLTLRMRVDEHDRGLAGVIEGSFDFALVWYPGRLAGLPVRSLGY